MESESYQPSNIEYLDFELEILNGSGLSYPIAVVRSAAGEARETMHFPFDELALENQLLILQNALLRSGGKRRRLPSPEERTVQQFGQALFEALFVGEVRSQYAVSQREASSQGKGLRLKLRILPPDMAALPWEFLYDPQEAEYICLSSHTPIVRYIELPRPPQPLAVIPPLSILGMIANPQDLDRLDIEREQQRVEKAIEQLQVDGLVKLTWLQGQTWQDLQRAMRRGPWHIFHFIGHGGFDHQADEGLIALSTDEGSAHYLSATQVGRLLADHRSLRLVVLNSCEGARGGRRDIFSSTASILIKRGIPAVLAMQYEITDLAAIELSRAFYETIADGLPVDAAVGEARKAISLGIVNTVEWGTPTLYMRSQSGVLFDIVAKPVPKVEEQSIMPRPFISPSVPSNSHDEVPSQTSSKDFFISYTAADHDWAEWVAWQLEEVGYSIVLQAWDFRAGSNFVLNMQNALHETKRVVLILSDHYLKAGFTQPEWAAAFRQDPKGEQGVVVPVRVQECKPEGLLGSVVYIDLVGLEESEARKRLLEDIRSERGKPASPPTFPKGGHRTLKQQPSFPVTQTYRIPEKVRLNSETSKKEASSTSTQAREPSLVTPKAYSKGVFPTGKKYVLALDQGTTSSRAIVFNHEGAIVSIAQQEFPQIYPAPGIVEHDPEAIWSSQLTVAQEAMKKAGATAADVAAIGITNQRETTVVWEKRTGRPVFNAIVWQSRMTVPICDALKAKGFDKEIRERTGLVTDAYFSGSKVKWILDNVPGVREKAERGEILFGNIDTFLMWRLSKGRVHATDPSNASRTLMYNIYKGDWDDVILKELGVPRAMLPTVMASSGVFGETDPQFFGGAIKMAGDAGDQQAATFGQACFEPGMSKNTYGTGNFMLMNTGTKGVPSQNGLLTTIGWRVGNGPTIYCLESVIFITGAAVQWLRDSLKAIKSSGDVEALAGSVPDNGGVYMVPAFVGIGAPYWDPYARGTIIGLTRGSKVAHIARATLESTCYQTRDVLEAMSADSGVHVKTLRVDGGAVVNNLLMQFQADILGVPVQRPKVAETTALGAAYLAGIATGFWSSAEEVAEHWAIDRTFEPKMGADQREKLYANWKRAVERSMHWEQV